MSDEQYARWRAELEASRARKSDRGAAIEALSESAYERLSDANFAAGIWKR